MSKNLIKVGKSQIAIGELLIKIQYAISEMERYAYNLSNYEDLYTIQNFWYNRGQYDSCMDILVSLDTEAYEEIIKEFDRHVTTLIKMMDEVTRKYEHKGGDDIA